MTDMLGNVKNNISDAGAIRRIVENMYNGWGYNAYSKKNQLRADDLLIRGKISELLSDLRNHWSLREQEWRLEHLPEPTREHPFPDANAVKAAQSMQAIQKLIESFEAVIRTAEVPTNDKVWQRHRDEGITLTKLMDIDNAILEILVGMLESSKTATVADFSLTPLKQLWDERQKVLFNS